jgi:cytochrome c peroxidase
MPLYTLVNKTTQATIQTTDPGRALVTGKWKDIGKFKGPVLRGLSARAPYFHNGFAATLDEVITFYVTRFGVVLTSAERADLLHFLESL